MGELMAVDENEKGPGMNKCERCAVSKPKGECVFLIFVR